LIKWSNVCFYLSWDFINRYESAKKNSFSLKWILRQKNDNLLYGKLSQKKFFISRVANQLSQYWFMLLKAAKNYYFSSRFYYSFFFSLSLPHCLPNLINFASIILLLLSCHRRWIHFCIFKSSSATTTFNSQQHHTQQTQHELVIVVYIFMCI
jgi:hypothetical protein